MFLNNGTSACLHVFSRDCRAHLVWLHAEDTVPDTVLRGMRVEQGVVVTRDNADCVWYTAKAN
ncbi:hypothetical protein [Enterobacillus tribolii]|uniref:hypothetical protein n=1 Tax=Enterobacillus tribolii TaxID=1487935 RepID=UPI0011C01D03|nr:hypothetical protein [Enterobacillus tribolii]MBW7983528.1 hypothetical protein [Enterobacillus tribolii]